MADDKKQKKEKPKGQFMLYEKSGESLKRKNRSCPKCGPSIFLAKHKDRVTCGKCGYTEMGPKKEDKK